jgi:putative tricarboxylic transport membrane protein
MLEMFLLGFSSFLTPQCLLLLLLGVFIGIIFGSIPGLTAAMAVALFLPITFQLEPIQGIVLLIGLYVGGISGGLITAILINIPGTPASIATAFDGFPMAQKGQAYKALGTGILFSCLGGLFSAFALIFISPLLADFAIKIRRDRVFCHFTVFLDPDLLHCERIGHQGRLPVFWAYCSPASAWLP